MQKYTYGYDFAEIFAYAQKLCSVIDTTESNIIYVIFSGFHSIIFVHYSLVFFTSLSLSIVTDMAFDRKCLRTDLSFWTCMCGSIFENITILYNIHMYSTLVQKVR